MIERRTTTIVNYSGGAAAAMPRFSAYGVSKAAVGRFTETLSEEVKDLGIRVNAIARGAVDTTLKDEALADGGRAISSRACLACARPDGRCEGEA